MRFALRDAMLVAAAVHTAVWAFVAHRPATRRIEPAPAPLATIEIARSLEAPPVEPTAAATAPPPARPVGALRDPGAERGRIDRGAPEGGERTPTAEATTGGRAPSPNEGAREAGDAWSASRFVNRAPDLAETAAATRAFAAHEADRQADDRDARGSIGMRATLHDRDVALGLARGGPVIAVVEEATRALPTPVDGAASLDVTFDAEGALVDARVVEANGHRGAWDEVARGLKERFGRRRLRVPPGAKGLRVALRVEAKLQLANGGDPMPMQVCVAPLPCAGTPGHPNRRRVRISPIPPFVAVPFDPTDLAPPARVVSAHVVREELL